MRSMLLAVALALPAPALAQADAAPPATPAPLPSPDELAGDDDALTIGLGAAYLPDYEGSDDYRVIPGGAVRGKLSGHAFWTRSTYLYVDLVPQGSSGIDIDVGPIAGVRLNRKGKTDDALVARLPRAKAAIEIGGFAGVSLSGLTNPYDQLSLRLDAVKDVGDGHGSTVLTPTIDFGTPLSRTFYAGASLSADIVGDGYADTYFSITPADSLASGLAPFDADGGLKNWKVSLLANQSLSGDLRKGFALFATGSYSRLVGDFKRSPIVADRGSAGQWFAAAGLAYSF